MMSGWQAFSFTSTLAVALALIHWLRPYPGTELPDAEQVMAEYDFVIIGAGSSGTVLANRLTENADWTVLLFEAGGRETELAQIPRQAGSLTQSELDWNTTTAPPVGNQRYCLAMTDLICRYPRGKVIGGSSSINGMLYVRGNRYDFDHWESLGNVGWGYDHILKYFLKSEDNTNPYLLETPYHAAGGYQGVEDDPFIQPLAELFLEAAKYLGYGIHDINGKNQSGFSRSQVTGRGGSRCSTARGFILPVHERPNLSISFYSLVTKINFDLVNSEPKASSVTFVKNGKSYTVKARKEVILSAGTFGSPQVLMLSGIGPTEHLTELGIKQLKNLKVGYNLQDHVTTILTFITAPNKTLSMSDTRNSDTLLDYYLRKEGPLTSCEGADALAFINTEFSPPSGCVPDIELFLKPESFLSSDEKPIGQRVHNFRPNLFDGTGYERVQNDSLFDIAVVLLTPKSRGRVKLRSKNPFDQPIVDVNYFADREDVLKLISGLRQTLELVATPPFQAVGAAPLPYPFPGCERYPLYSNCYLECLMRHFTVPWHHQVGTCAMGVTPEAVVDPRLRVKGVAGLRVIDASVMPFTPRGNTNAPTIMVAEKGADMIKEDWRASESKNKMQFFEYTW